MMPDNRITRLFPPTHQPTSETREGSRLATVELRPVLARRSSVLMPPAESEGDEGYVPEKGIPMPSQATASPQIPETQFSRPEPAEQTNRIEQVVERVRVEHQLQVERHLEPAEPRTSISPRPEYPVKPPEALHRRATSEHLVPPPLEEPSRIDLAPKPATALSISRSPKLQEMVESVHAAVKGGEESEQRIISSPLREPRPAQEHEHAQRSAVIVPPAGPSVSESKQDLLVPPPAPPEPKISSAAAAIAVSVVPLPATAKSAEEHVPSPVIHQELKTEAAPIQPRPAAVIGPPKLEPVRAAAAVHPPAQAATPVGISVRIGRIEIIARAPKSVCRAAGSVRSARTHQIEPNLPLKPGGV